MGEVLIVSGTDKFRCNRFIKQFVTAHDVPGWRIERVDAKVPGSVVQAMSGGDFFEEQILVVVTNPEAGDLALYKGHPKDDPATVLLHIDGDPDGRTKFGRWVGTMKAASRSFSAPKPWEQEAVAVSFVNDEVKALGKSFARPDLARALVGRAGAELGALAFEVLKASLLADFEGCTVISADHLRQTLTDFAGSDAFALQDALALREPKAIARALVRIEKVSKDDPTMGTCRGLVGQGVIKWFMLGALLSKGVGVDEAASKIQANPWLVRNKMLPAVQRWNHPGDLAKLVQVFAAGERAVLDGHVSPWAEFSATLLTLCEKS